MVLFHFSQFDGGELLEEEEVLDILGLLSEDLEWLVCHIQFPLTDYVSIILLHILGTH